jgi:hypothetical protein
MSVKLRLSLRSTSPQKAVTPLAAALRQYKGSDTTSNAPRTPPRAVTANKHPFVGCSPAPHSGLYSVPATGEPWPKGWRLSSTSRSLPTHEGAKGWAGIESRGAEHGHGSVVTDAEGQGAAVGDPPSAGRAPCPKVSEHTPLPDLPSPSSSAELAPSKISQHPESSS